jgi:hypothetical protein
MSVRLSPDIFQGEKKKVFFLWNLKPKLKCLLGKQLLTGW